MARLLLDAHRLLHMPSEALKRSCCSSSCSSSCLLLLKLHGLLLQLVLPLLLHQEVHALLLLLNQEARLLLPHYVLLLQQPCLLHVEGCWARELRHAMHAVLLCLLAHCSIMHMLC